MRPGAVLVLGAGAAAIASDRHLTDVDQTLTAQVQAEAARLTVSRAAAADQ